MFIKYNIQYIERGYNKQYIIDKMTTAENLQQQQEQTNEETAQPMPDIKKRGRGRPAGSGEKGLKHKLPFEMEVKNGYSYYYQYLPRKNKHGETRYYKHTMKYKRHTERKKKTRTESPETMEQKQKQINDLRRVIYRKRDELSLAELETLNRIFKELDIAPIKETIIRLYGPNLQQQPAGEVVAV